MDAAGVTKYRNKPCVIDGRRFDSQKEGRHYLALRTLERAGKIQDLECQVPYRLDVNGHKVCTYRADFRYLVDGNLVVEDVKGVATPLFRLKAKLMKALLGIEVRCV